jgi:nicotinamide mononucleotide (NMN) deamidase PncC
MIGKLLNLPISIYINTSTAGILADFTSAPGSSKIFVGGSVNYASELTRELLSLGKGDKIVSSETAVKLANDAYLKAFEFGKDMPIGIGITAAMGYEGQREGRFNGAYIAVRTAIGINKKLCILDKIYDRTVADDLIAKDTMVEIDVAYSWEAGHTHLNCHYESYYPLDERTPEFILPITGDPVHWAHIKGLHWAEKVLGKRGAFQYTRNHPTKGTADIEKVNDVIARCNGFGSLYVDDNYGMYAEKAEKYGLPIVMGDDALALFLSMANSTKVSLPVPVYVLSRIGIPPEEILKMGAFPLMNPKWDISSTQLRK